jgi:hypothetical protein
MGCIVVPPLAEPALLKMYLFDAEHFDQRKDCRLDHFDDEGLLAAQQQTILTSVTCCVLLVSGSCL